MKVHIGESELWPYYYVNTKLNEHELVVEIDQALIDRLNNARLEIEQVQKEIRSAIHQAEMDKNERLYFST